MKAIYLFMLAAAALVAADDETPEECALECLEDIWDDTCEDGDIACRCRLYDSAVQVAAPCLLKDCVLTDISQMVLLDPVACPRVNPAQPTTASQAQTTSQNVPSETGSGQPAPTGASDNAAPSPTEATETGTQAGVSGTNTESAASTTTTADSGGGGSSGGSGLSTGEKAGIGIAIAFGVLGIAAFFVVFFMLRRRKAKKEQDAEKDDLGGAIVEKKSETSSQSPGIQEMDGSSKPQQLDSKPIVPVPEIDGKESPRELSSEPTTSPTVASSATVTNSPTVSSMSPDTPMMNQGSIKRKPTIHELP